jgi:hypothetical protein
MNQEFKSKYSISDTFKLNYDVNHIDNIVRLYIIEKFDRGKNIIEQYKIEYDNLHNNYLTMVEYLNLECSLKKLKQQIIEIYNSDIMIDNINNNYTNFILQNYHSDSKHYLLLIRGMNEYINNNRKDYLINILEKDFYVNYNETLKKIENTYNITFSSCEEPNWSLCVLNSNSENISREIYNYVIKIIVTMDDKKFLKYIKSDIIVDYIYVAKKYNPNIYISRDIQYKNRCYCNIWYKNLPVDESGKHVCSCGFEEQEISTEYCFDKTISKKAKDNFRKAFSLLQGNIKPPHFDSIVLKLDKYFENYSINIKKLIKSRDYITNGKIRGTTRDMLVTALKKIGYSSHTVYINYYLREYFHWNIKKYNEIEDKIMLLYDETISCFVKIKDPQRNSAPNVWYHLLWLLLEIGEECYLEDFKIPENDSLVELENYRKKICALRHVHFIPIMSMVKN